MALIVFPGTPPEDGAAINPSIDIVNYVRGTSVENFGVENFGAGSDISFVFSSTEPPVTSARTRATLWFKRGEGRMYKWFEFTPKDGEESGTTDARWIAISDRREILAKARFPVDTGSLISLDAEKEEMHGEEQHHEFMMPLVSATNYTGSEEAWWISRKDDPTDPILVSMTDVTDYTGLQRYQVFVEAGYCDAKCDSGFTGPDRGVFKRGTVTDAAIFQPGDYEATGPRVLQMTASGVSLTGPEVVSVFLNPSLSHLVR